MSRFDQDRKEWAQQLDAQAERYYQEFWEVDPTDIYDLESVRSGEYETDDGVETDHIIDYAGIDKIIDCSWQVVFLAQRFRPASDQYDVDFSFRTENGIPGKAAEYDKLLNGYRNLGTYPGVYAFGITDAETNRFEEFHLIDTRAFLDRIDRHELDAAGPYSSDNGTRALYYPVDHLRAQDCLVASWEGDDLVFDRREHHAPPWRHTQDGETGDPHRP